MLIFLITIMLHSHPTWAELGGDPGTFAKDVQAYGGTPVAAPQVAGQSLAQGVQVHQFEAHGITFKEFAYNNKIFAVTWRGLTHPDLKGLLGQFFPEYSEKVSEPRPPNHSRAGLRISTAHVTVYHGGHQHDLRGAAFLAGQFPPGMTEADLR